MSIPCHPARTSMQSRSTGGFSRLPGAWPSLVTVLNHLHTPQGNLPLSRRPLIIPAILDSSKSSNQICCVPHVMRQRWGLEACSALSRIRRLLPWPSCSCFDGSTRSPFLLRVGSPTSTSSRLVASHLGSRVTSNSTSGIFAFLTLPSFCMMSAAYLTLDLQHHWSVSACFVVVEAAKATSWMYVEGRRRLMRSLLVSASYQGLLLVMYWNIWNRISGGRAVMLAIVR